MKKKEEGPLQVEFICPGCGIWVTEKNRKRPEVEVFLPVDGEQTVLFSK